MQMLIQSPINQTIRLDLHYFYNSILQKHPVLEGNEEMIIRSLESPFTIRRSRQDSNVLLYYGLFQNRMLCSVVKITQDYCFLITSYPCDSVKKGEILWQK